jgi:NitT/TauT family transport system ATP-binding protein
LQGLALELCTEQRLTMVMVTHSIEEAAMMGRKILFLDHPPTRNARIFDNPEAGTAGFRQQEQYFQLCRTLRQEMGSEIQA